MQIEPKYYIGFDPAVRGREDESCLALLQVTGDSVRVIAFRKLRRAPNANARVMSRKQRIRQHRLQRRE